MAMSQLFVGAIVALAAHRIQALSFDAKEQKPAGSGLLHTDKSDVSLELGAQYVTALRRQGMPQGLLEGRDWQSQVSWVSPKSFKALKEHHKDTTEKGTPDVQRTYIRDLGTEYVGQIGLGTVSHPKGCGSMKQTRPGRLVKETACASREQQSLEAVFDTGSTNLWMASTLCKTGYCVAGNRKRYDFLESETYQEPKSPENLDIEFGTATLRGRVGIDDFHIGPFTVKNQSFGMIEEELGSTFQDLPLEGIVGLGFPALGAETAHPFFDNVISQHVLKRNMFCFYLQEIDSDDDGNALLSKDGRSFNGAILWGGYDKSLFKGEMMWFPVTDAFYWAIDLYGFKIGNKSFTITASEDSSDSLEETTRSFMRKHTPRSTGAPAKLIVDTGTTYYAADGALYRQIKHELTNCAESPTITYQLKDANGKIRDLVLEPNKFWVGASSGNCELGFMKVGPSPQYGPAMLLGELFMQQYFTVFDRGDGSDSNARVGFATLKNKMLSSLMDMPAPPFAGASASSIEVDGRGELRSLHP